MDTTLVVGRHKIQYENKINVPYYFKHTLKSTPTLLSGRSMIEVHNYLNLLTFIFIRVLFLRYIISTFFRNVLSALTINFTACSETNPNKRI